MITHVSDDTVQDEPLPTASMAMPSLLYRTNAIKKRVLESNRAKSVERVAAKPPPNPPTSEKPEWMKKSAFV